MRTMTKEQKISIAKSSDTITIRYEDYHEFYKSYHLKNKRTFNRQRVTAIGRGRKCGYIATVKNNYIAFLQY